MRLSVGNTLRAYGLVLATGPLCFTAAAATYVDVEAERAAAQAAGGGSSNTGGTVSATANDPYGAQPAGAYPATSYGATNAPAATSGIAPVSSPSYPPPTTATAAPAPVAGSSAVGSQAGNLYLQIQQLQQEVMRLNGKLEEQAYELSALKEQSLQRYMDLDKRLGGAGAAAQSPASGPATQTTKPATASGAINAAAPLSAPTTAGTPSPGVEQPGEADSYRAAYALVQGRQFDQAVTAFQQFLQRYPDGVYAANAHYWLGELYLVKSPPDLEASRQAFALLLSQYPDSSKAPDALFKLGRVQFLKGNREKAREYLDLVITQYEGTNNAVVQLARDFIAQNY